MGVPEGVDSVWFRTAVRAFARPDRDPRFRDRGSRHEVTKRGRSVYTTDRVPPAYLRIRDTGGCKYVKTRIGNPGGNGLYPQMERLVILSDTSDVLLR